MAGAHKKVTAYRELKAAFEAAFRVDERTHPGFGAAHWFAGCFQLRRAFFHIFRFIVGTSRASARLRGAVWEAIFTADAARYRRSLVDRMKDVPTLVLGDFNEGVGGVAVEYLEDRGYTNALPLYRPGQFTWRGNSVANQFTQTLDHVLFDSSFEPLNAWVTDTGGSDHLPVVVHLEQAFDWAAASP